MQSAMFSTDDTEFSSTPPDIIEEASDVVNNLLPVKSEKVYFEEMSKTMKFPTLWTNYSVLKTTLNVKHGIDISQYTKLYSLLKQKSVGYNGKKAKIFSTDEIKTFIDEAPDNTHLLIKVCKYNYSHENKYFPKH
ncbi:hypothetical protein C0J52_14813 [Blattella germanica]|nr:hypothetical protein C0J52_14813 [Blattella germanica]